MDQAAIVRALLRPEAYRDAVERPLDRVEHLETHISHLFFAGRRVFKVKKDLRLEFLDYGTLDRRRHFCEEEVRLNRRLAPRVYLGTVPIVPSGEGAVRVDGDGDPVEWAVEMVRLPAERMLERLLDDGGFDEHRLRALVGVLVRFHAEAETGDGVDEHGTPDAVSGKVLGNLEEAETHVEDGVLSRTLHRFLDEAARSFLGRHRGLLERRVEERRIREGHGDLHASNVCFPPDELAEDGVAIYDCIEFDRALRCGDVASDLAFLAMDLDRRGHAAASDRLIARYAETTADRDLPALLGLYKGYRAVVRAKVAALAARGGTEGAGDPAERRDEARSYFQLAAACALPPALVLTSGLPATGKSWLARRLAGRLGAVVLRSDVARKRLAGLDPSDSADASWGEGLYREEMTDRTYDRLLERAAETLDRGRSVIVDATFPTRARRDPFLRLAERRGHEVAIVHVRASEETVRERIERRREDRDDPSDAGLDVYLRARESFERPDGSDRRVVTFDSGRDDPAELAARMLESRIAGSGATIDES